MTKNNYGDTFVTPVSIVRWSHLMKPDDKFGNPNHSVSVIVTDELQAQLDTALAELGGNKINGLKADKDTGDMIMRFKNVLKAREGLSSFPILDSDDNITTTVPFATDTVRVKVTPALISRDDSVSFYMDKIQLVERNWEPSGDLDSGGMGKVKGGFVAATAEGDDPF